MFSDTTEIVFYLNRKSFLSTVKVLFHQLERTFHRLERTFHRLERTFHPLEHNFCHREKTFSPLSYNKLSTMFQKCGKYADKKAWRNAEKRMQKPQSPHAGWHGGFVDEGNKSYRLII